MACSSCGELLPDGANFCPHCGTRVLIPAQDDGQRRHASIVFSDLSGYTALSERLDPEEVESIMARVKAEATRIIGRHGGVINQFIGDEVVALFGIPVARRDDAQRAVRAARELHAAVRAIGAEIAPRTGHGLTLHTGINTGLVVTRRTDTRDGHFSLTGDAVNTGARLLGLAGPDEVLIGPDTWREVGSDFSAIAGNDIEVKGKAQPIVPYRVTGERTDRTADRWPLVGREAELTHFEAVALACATQARGGLLVVRGDPGIGKSRLAAECVERAARHGIASHTAQVLDFSVGRGSDPLRNLMRSLLGIGRDADDRAALHGLHQAWDDGLADPDQALFLCELLDITRPDGLRALDAALTAESREAGVRAALGSLVRAAARRQPLLLLVEDVHWADDTLLARLAALAARADGVSGPALLLVLTTRVDGDPLGRGWFDTLPRSAVTVWDLAPLAADRAAELAVRFPGLDAAVVQALVRRADGNPLFLEQLLLNAGGAGPSDVPGSIQALVLARMDQLPPVERQRFQAASVLGQRFSLDALRHLVADDRCDCAVLAERQLLRAAGPDWQFSHALIRDGAYESLLKSRRRALHARAGEWFSTRDPQLGAEHFELAQDARAPGAFLAASHAEAGRYRFDRAEALAARGLALAQQPGQRHALALMRARMRLDSGRAHDALTAAQDTLALATTPAERAATLILQAAALRILDQSDAALAALAAAEPLARQAGSALDLARLHHLRGGFFFVLGRSADCLREHQAALAHARAAGSVEAEANALSGLGDADYVAGRMHTANERFRACVALAQQHGLGGVDVANRHMLGWTSHYLGRFDEAIATGEEAVAMARRVSARRTEALARQTVAYTQGWLMGDLAPALAHLDQALPVVRALGAVRFEAQNRVFRALLALRAGQREQAQALAREALAFTRSAAMGFIGPTACGVLAQTTTDAAERRQVLAEGEALLAAGSISHNHFDFRACAIEASLESGDFTAVDRHCEALARYTAAEPLVWSTLAVERGRLLARRGRGEHGPELDRALRALREQTAQRHFNVWLPALDAATGA